jgi:hypothetical protein
MAPTSHAQGNQRLTIVDRSFSQSGKFDHPDRLFSSMKKSWLASSGGLSPDMQVCETPAIDDSVLHRLVLSCFTHREMTWCRIE